LIGGRIRGVFLCAVTIFFENFGELMAKMAGSAVGDIRFQFTQRVKEIGAG
jgi:hypothetical protein